MKTIQTAISVDSDGTAVIELQLPRDVSAGVHRAVVIVEDQAAITGQREDTPSGVAAASFAGWPKDCTFRREDLYGNDGR